MENDPFTALLAEGAHRALSEESLALLVAHCPGRLPQLLDAIHAAMRAQKRNLSQVIARLRGPEAVQALIDLLSDVDRQVGAAAMQALGRSRDARALEPLLAQLLDRERRLREDAASALGELKKPQAIPALLQVVEEILGQPEDPQAIPTLIAREQESTPDDWQARVSRRLRLLIAAITALAKLGDQHLSHLVIGLMGFQFAKDRKSTFAARVREEAIFQSVYLAAPGLLPALQAARRREPSGDDVIDFSLLGALFYLGLRESVDEFVVCFEQDYPTGRSADEALSRIAGLVGETPPGEIDALKIWWQARREQFAPGVCYRWGQPLEVAAIVAHLPGVLPIQTSLLFSELTVITGEHFEPDYALPPEQQEAQRIAKARAWAEQYAPTFEPGCLYKYGYKQVGKWTRSGNA